MKKKSIKFLIFNHKKHLMKKVILSFLIVLLISCHVKQEKTAPISNSIQADKAINKTDELFILQERISENFVSIIPPKNSDFDFPDSAAKTEPYKSEDFNADGKQDIMVYLGACGTGGCVYAIFLNEKENYYKLAFMDYLKGTEFEKENNGSILSLIHI